MRLCHVEVKEDECCTHGLCVDRLPEVFEFPDDGGVARVRSGASDLFDARAEEIRFVAAQLCPVEAILLRYDDGKEIFSRKPVSQDLRDLWIAESPSMDPRAGSNPRPLVGVATLIGICIAGASLWLWC